MFCDNYQNIDEYLQHLVCDCAIMVEMKVEYNYTVAASKELIQAYYQFYAEDFSV